MTHFNIQQQDSVCNSNLTAAYLYGNILPSATALLLDATEELATYQAFAILIKLVSIGFGLFMELIKNEFHQPYFFFLSPLLSL